jgi:hypothetical protein
MASGILRACVWSLSICSAYSFNVACGGGGSSDNGTEVLTATECTDRGGEAVEQASCPRGRDQLGSLESDARSAACCETVPILTKEQCEAQGADPHADPGGGSTYRDGCPAGEKMLGTLDYGIEGGICCK